MARSTFRSRYVPSNWYWIVAGSNSQVYSSAAGAYVPNSNSTYQAWLSAGNNPTRIDSEQNLTDVLVLAGLAPVPSTPKASDTITEGAYSSLPLVLRNWMLDLDNRVRALEGQPTRTKTQFRQYVKSL